MDVLAAGLIALLVLLLLADARDLYIVWYNGLHERVPRRVIMLLTARITACLVAAMTIACWIL